jgi:putative transposase
MKDYQARGRPRPSQSFGAVLTQVAEKRPEAGHRKVRAYALAWKQMPEQARGTSRMSCYRMLKANGWLQPGKPGRELRRTRESRRQLLVVPEQLNTVLQADFTDYRTEDGEWYHIGGVTEYLSRFNLVSLVLERESAIDLIDVVQAALIEIGQQGHQLPGRVVLITDNGPAMKSRVFKNFIERTKLLVHVRGQKYHPQTIGRQERYHGSLKLEHLYRILPANRKELLEEVNHYRQFYNHKRLHMALNYRTPAAVYLEHIAQNTPLNADQKCS